MWGKEDESLVMTFHFQYHSTKEDSYVKITPRSTQELRIGGEDQDAEICDGLAEVSRSEEWAGCG
jgi:hypothetical protein